jgi:hypothetical protein
LANDDEKRSPDDAEDEREAPEGEEDEQDSHEGDDEGDESESADEGDESESDDEGDDEGDEPEAAAGSAEAAAKKKTGRKHKASGKISAGQRLAAAKAAKAAKKIAQRGKEAEVVEEQAVETATVASTWLDRNRNKLLGAFAAVLLLGGAFFGIRAMQQKSAAEASQLLWEATEILNASIQAPGEEDTAEDAVDAETDEDEVTYETIAARADAALAKLDELFASHGDSPAAAWGRLEEGRARYQKGEHAEARTAFEAALAQGGEALAPRALEGIAFTYEAEENWDEAVARFEQLREEGGALQILADYHLARIHLAKNEEDPAKTKLQAVLEALREEDAPELAYVRDQAELRLMAIDSSLVQRDAAGQMDPAEMQRLIEQLTRQQQQQGGAP